MSIEAVNVSMVTTNGGTAPKTPKEGEQDPLMGFTNNEENSLAESQNLEEMLACLQDEFEKVKEETKDLPDLSLAKDDEKKVNNGEKKAKDDEKKVNNGEKQVKDDDKEVKESSMKKIQERKADLLKEFNEAQKNY